MTTSKQNFIDYFVLYDYHNTAEAEAAVKDFCTLYMGEYSKLLSSSHFSGVAIEIDISELGLRDTLHHAKHKLEHFAPIFSANKNPYFAYKESDNLDQLPDAFKEQFLNIEKGPSPNILTKGLVGNCGTLNEYRQAACYVYFFSKIKPLKGLNFKVKDDEVDKRLKAFFERFINEHFALSLFGSLSTIDSSSADLNSRRFLGEESYRLLELLRYKNITPQSLEYIFQIWGRP